MENWECSNRKRWRKSWGIMANNKLLIRGFDKCPERTLGFGDMMYYFMVCYFRGKYLGYDEIHTFKPLYHPKVINIGDSNTWQSTPYLPITLLKQPVYDAEYDLVLDISVPGSLFEGHKGMHKHFWETCRYLNLYYLNTNKAPYLTDKRTWKGTPYIIFQYRYMDKSFDNICVHNPYRNTSFTDFEDIFNLFRNQYGDKYEYWKIGEPTPIDDKFDYILPPMWNDIDGFAEIVRNTSMLVTAQSGPNAFSIFHNNTPCIVISSIENTCWDNPQVWKRIVGTGSGIVFPLWHMDKMLTIRKECVNQNINVIKQFNDKWLL